MGKEKLKIDDKDKLNVLCLHGYRQNGDTFKSKTGSFRKSIKNFCNLTYITAEHFAQNEEVDESQRSWWFNKDDGSFKGTNQNGPAIGFEKSLKLVERTWNEGNFQGLIGFSQGASMVSLIASMAERNFTTIKPRFVMMAAGFKSGSLVHKNCYENKISIPSLHVYGKNDDIISHELSEKLVECFVDPVTISHAGGHYFPATVNEKQLYVDFFKDQLQAFLEDRELKLNGLTINDNIGEEEEEVDAK